jgi:hypothetical protein
MAKGIRSYGPGKFYTILDGYAYEVGLDGFDEEESYPDGGGSYGLLRLDDSAREAISKTAADNEDPTARTACSDSTTVLAKRSVRPLLTTRIN